MLKTYMQDATKQKPQKSLDKESLYSKKGSLIREHIDI